MRPTICTYSRVIAVPGAGPWTWAAVVGIGTCCACAVVHTSAASAKVMRTSLSFTGVSPRRSFHFHDVVGFPGQPVLPRTAAGQPRWAAWLRCGRGSTVLAALHLAL